MSGLPVILLHAFPLSSAMWEEERRWLAERFRVVAPDLPGFATAPRQAAPSVPAMAQAVADRLDREGVREPAVISGLSMGGYVALEFLRQFPGRVRGLGLFSTRAAPDSPETREGRLKNAKRIRREGLAAFAEGMIPRLLGKTTLNSKPEVVEHIRRMIAVNSPEGVADALLAMAERQDSSDLLHGIHCPALVVAGDEDPFIPVPESRAMASQIAGSELAVIRGAGHLINLEQPQEFRRVFERFLDRLGRAV